MPFLSLVSAAIALTAGTNPQIDRTVVEVTLHDALDVALGEARRVPEFTLTVDDLSVEGAFACGTYTVMIEQSGEQYFISNFGFVVELAPSDGLRALRLSASGSEIVEHCPAFGDAHWADQQLLSTMGSADAFLEEAYAHIP